MINPLPRYRIASSSKVTLVIFVWILIVHVRLHGQEQGEIDVAAGQGGQSVKSDETMRQQVDRWLNELDAPSSISRRKSERALLNAGPEILGMLPEKQLGFSSEANERLARIRQVLSARQEEQLDPPAQRMIRLDGVKTLGEALEEISLETGVNFACRKESETPIQPIRSSLPFWHSLDLVLDEAGLDINFYGGARETLQLIDRLQGRPSRVDSACYAGIYRVEPMMVYARRTFRQAELSSLNVSIEISWEPNVTPIGLSLPVQELKAVLDDGEILLPQPSGETIDVITNGEISFSECSLPFQLPAGRPDRIESLQGVLNAMLPGERKRFELPLNTGTGKVSIDSMSVSLEGIRENGELHQLVIGVDLEQAGRALESHRQWIFENEVFVERPDGSRINHLGYEVVRQTDSGVGISYLFDLESGFQGFNLVYESPTEVISSQVGFTLKEIALP